MGRGRVCAEICAPIEGNNLYPGEQTVRLVRSWRTGLLRLRDGIDLARGYGCVRKLGARGTPDRADALTGVDKNRGRRECDKGHQEGVFNQVLALFVFYEIHEHLLHWCVSSSLLVG